MRAHTVGMLVLAAGLLGGCGGEDPAPVDYPEDAVQLRQNVPTPVEGYTLTAVNLEAERGIVVVAPPDGTATNVPVEEGGTLRADDLAFEVLDIVTEEGGGDEPGAKAGLVVLVAEDGQG